LEAIDAWAYGRQARYMGKGWKGVGTFLLSNHMTSITMSFLVYAGSKTSVLAFAVFAGIASKYVFRVQVDGRTKHFFNPSNFGIVATLIFFPWVNTIPYQFTEWLPGNLDWMVTAIVFALGFRLNFLFTQRLYVIFAWAGGFLLQGVLRSALLDTPIMAELLPFTGPAFVLFTFYMITDPMTSPQSPRAQLVFGASIAFFYWFYMALHIPNQIFLCVTTVTGIRGVMMWVAERRKVYTPKEPSAKTLLEPQSAAVAVGR
jgi:hypothetical protein